MSAPVVGDADRVDTEPATSTLDPRVAGGARWSVANSLVSRVGSLVAGMILARLLTPVDFGVYATALVVLNVLLSMNELGVSLAIVRWDADVQEFGPTVSTIAIVGSTIMCALAFVASPLIAHVLGDPAATGVLRLMSLNVVIDGIFCVNAALLAREFLQRRRFAIDVSNFAVGTGVTILLAAAGSGAASFAWGRLCGGVLALVMVFLMTPGRIWPGWDGPTAGRLVRFGAPLAGASLLVLAMLNVDYVVVGAILGPAALGLYMLAFNLSSWPVNFFSEATRRVSFAAFSRLVADSQALGRAFTRGVGLLMTVSMPVSVVLATLAQPIIHILYGAQWTGAAVALKYLAALGLARIVLELCYDCLIAVGRSKGIMVLQGTWLVCLIPTLVVGARVGGIAGVGVGHVLVAYGVVLPMFGVVLHRASIPVARAVASLRRPALGGAAMAIVIYLVSLLDLAPLALLLAAGTAGLAAYGALAVPWRTALASARGWRRHPTHALVEV